LFYFAQKESVPKWNYALGPVARIREEHTEGGCAPTQGSLSGNVLTADACNMRGDFASAKMGIGFGCLAVTLMRASWSLAGITLLAMGVAVCSALFVWRKRVRNVQEMDSAGGAY
jgi:hypothetical protein